MPLAMSWQPTRRWVTADLLARRAWKIPQWGAPRLRQRQVRLFDVRKILRAASLAVAARVAGGTVTMKYVAAFLCLLIASTALALDGQGRASHRSALITAEYDEVDLREALRDLSRQTGVQIISDESAEGVFVTLRLDAVPLEEALDKLLLFGSLHWKKKDETLVLVSAATPDARFFREFAVTRRYVPQHQSALSLAALLPPLYDGMVLADEESNVLSITAPEPLMARLLDDLRVIDAPSRQFVVEALIAEVTTDRGQDTGFSWSLGQFAGDASGLSYTTATQADVIRLQALLTEGRATLRANPRLTAFEGRPAMINVGQDTYLLVFQDLVFLPRSQAQVIQTGITLSFTGFISEDGWITLRLEPEVSDAVVTIDQNPTTAVRRARTHVRVRSGETIAIGGLIQDAETRSVHRLPILGQIPLIGELFTHRRSFKRRTETVILITPHITETGAGTIKEPDPPDPPKAAVEESLP
jgi:type II secretory pathway component GspD/PulD (secretin)